MTARSPEPRPPNFETGEIWSPEGWIPYAYSERVAVCMESGMSEAEAMRVAADDLAREVGERMGHGGVPTKGGRDDADAGNRGER